MRITVLGASFTNDNLGVGALAIGTATCIAERVEAAEITLLDFARTATVHPFRLRDRVIPIPTVGMRMKPDSPDNAVYALLLAGVQRILPRGLRNWVVRKNTILSHLESSDVVLSIAGGDSFSDIYGYRRLFDVSLPQVLALWMGKPLVLLPQTLGPFEGTIAKAVARYIATRATVVYSRDQESLQHMRDLLGSRANPEKMKFCYDVGFLVPERAPEHVDVVGLDLAPQADAPLVGINVSGLLYIGGYTQNDAFGFRDRYVELTYQLIDYFVSQKHARVLLVPHTLGTGIESDSTVCAQLYEELKNKYPGKIGWLRGTYDTSELKHVIRKCDFFTGARMHACIGAWSLEVPAVAIAYSRKFTGVLETLGAAELVVDPRTMSNPDMVRILGETFERRAEVHAKLAARMPTVKQSILNLMPEICALSGQTAPGLQAARPGIVQG